MMMLCMRVCVVVEVLWWDIRKLQEPVDVFCLDVQKKPDCTNTTGVTCLEYEPTMVGSTVCSYSRVWR